MALPQIHPNWDIAPRLITDGFSLEMTAKDGPSLHEAAPLIPAETPIAVTFLPGEAADARIAAAVAVRELGFEPMPHFSARRITSEDDFEGYLHAVVAKAGVRRCFIVAGDPPEPQGPYFDTMALIETGAFERAGITAIGIGGHPEGHPNMTTAQCWDVLTRKAEAIAERGMAPLIVTQFGFDPDAFLDWLFELRARGIDAPVRIGDQAAAVVRRALRGWRLDQRAQEIRHFGHQPARQRGTGQAGRCLCCRAGAAPRQSAAAFLSVRRPDQDR